MTPATTERRRVARADGGRRQRTGWRPAQPATLFDALPEGPMARVDAREVAGSTVPAVAPAQGGEAGRHDSAAGSGETLDRLLVGGWESLSGHATTACLLCGGAMEPTYGVHPRPIGGRCRDCGTTLS